MNKGNIVLVKFPFTDLSGSKYRPAVVLCSNNADTTVCFVTTQIAWQESTDILLSPTEKNGLKKESLIRLNKIATLNKSLIKGLLGDLSKKEIITLNNNLKIVLKL